MDNKELQHAGIKGMKWGVRRYQNKDGSLTPAGKKRYGDNDGSGKPAKKVKPELTPEQKKARNKKIAIGVLATLGTAAVVAGTVAYIKNKDKVNASVKKFFKNSNVPKAEINSKKRMSQGAKKKFFKKTKIPKVEKEAQKRMYKEAKKKAFRMDIDELRKKTQEIADRIKYRETAHQAAHPGRAKVKEILAKSGSAAATTMVTGAILYGSKAAVTGKADRKEAMEYITPKPKRK
jgi:hypothetical protein